MPESFNLSVTRSWKAIQELRKKGVISQDQYTYFRYNLFEVLRENGLHKQWNDRELLEYLGYQPDITYEELEREIENDKPEGLFLQHGLFFHLGETCPIRNTNYHYLDFVLVQLAVLSAIQIRPFLDHHLSEFPGEKVDFIKFIKAMVRDHEGKLLSKGKTEAISEWIEIIQTGEKLRNVPVIKTGINHLPDLFNNPDYADKICEKLTTEKDHRQNPYLIRKVDNYPHYLYYWNSEIQYLAILHEHLRARGNLAVHKLKGNELAHLYSIFFNVENNETLKKFFQPGKRAKLYSLHKNLFSFIA